MLKPVIDKIGEVLAVGGLIVAAAGIVFFPNILLLLPLTAGIALLIWKLRTASQVAQLKTDHIAMAEEENQSLKVALNQRTRFEKLVTAISTDFINLPPSEIDRGIRHALQTLGEFAGVERSSIFLLHDNATTMDNTHEWCSPKATPRIDRFRPRPISDLNWLAQQIQSSRSVFFTGLGALPPTAIPEREFFAHWGAQSAYVVPLLYAGAAAGFITLESTDPRKVWDSDSVALLKIIAEVFVNTLERKLAEEALLDSEEHFRLLAENATDVIYRLRVHPTPGFDYVSPSAREVTGHAPEEFYADPHLALRLVHEDDHPLIAAIKDTRESSAISKSVRLHRRDGSLIWTDQRLVPIFNESDVLVAFEGIARDVTEQKRAEDELLRAREAALEASRVKSEFLANVSHEIRTPMNGIIGMTDLALETELSAEQRDYLQVVKSSANSLLSLINSILDLSKIESGKLDLEKIPFSLRDNLADTLKTLAVRAHEKGLELACDIADNITDAVTGDPGRLRQILVNLAGNAIKFTERGEVVINVTRTQATEREATLHFEVRDTGIGIPSDKQEIIFQPFEQADGSTTRKYGGTGLGLAISAQLVRMMGGRIWLESMPGVGSTFHFTVRFALPKEELAQTPAPRGDLKDLHGVDVLIVDDNATNRRILLEMLRGWGMRPVAVADALGALAALKHAHHEERPFPIALLDVQMPEMDGLTLAERIVSDDELKGTALVMLTSSGLRGDAARCRKLGVAGYLTKPIGATDLREALQAVMAHSTDTDTRELVTRHSLRETRRYLSVLVAEDNPVNRKVVVQLLQKRGHHVVSVEDGAQAVDAIEVGSFDIVLMDVQMPVMDGFEATNAIRSEERLSGKHIPIVALTAHAMMGDRERCLEAGMDAYLSKPIDADALFQLVQQLVPGYEKIGLGDQPTHPPTPAATSILNMDAVLKRVGGDRELLSEMIRLFMIDAPNLMAALRTAVAQSDAHTMERTAHRIKGSLGTLGAEITAAIAFELEVAGRTKALTPAPDALARLERSMNDLLPQLEALAVSHSHVATT